MDTQTPAKTCADTPASAPSDSAESHAETFPRGRSRRAGLGSWVRYMMNNTGILVYTFALG